MAGANLVNTAEYESYGRVFRQGMQDAHRTRFDDLVNIQDLRVLLREPAQGLPVHYPRPGRERDLTAKTMNGSWATTANLTCVRCYPYQPRTTA